MGDKVTSEQVNWPDPELIERRRRVGDFLGAALKNGSDHIVVRRHFDNLRYAEGILDSVAALVDDSIEHPHDPAELVEVFKGELAAAETAQQVVNSREYHQRIDASA